MVEKVYSFCNKILAKITFYLMKISISFPKTITSSHHSLFATQMLARLSFRTKPSPHRFLCSPVLSISNMCTLRTPQCTVLEKAKKRKDTVVGQNRQRNGAIDCGRRKGRRVLFATENPKTTPLKLIPRHNRAIELYKEEHH